MSLQFQLDPPQLTPRIFALLHAIRYGRLPWSKPGEKLATVKGATRQRSDKWVLCETHVYTDAEIRSMERAGWIGTEETSDPTERLFTTRGPKLVGALKQAFIERCNEPAANATFFL